VSKLKVLVFAPGEKPVVQEIDKGLEAMQAVVGGYIECVGLAPGIDLYCNEEGKLIGLPLNLRKKNPMAIAGGLPGDIIAGTFFVTRTNDEGESESLTDADIKKYTKLIG